MILWGPKRWWAFFGRESEQRKLQVERLKKKHSHDGFPWDEGIRRVYLPTWFLLIFIVDVGKYIIHGSYGIDSLFKKTMTWMCRANNLLGPEIWFHRKGLPVSRGFWWVHSDMIPLTQVQSGENFRVPRKDKNCIITMLYFHIHIMKFPEMMRPFILDHFSFASTAIC